MPNEESISLAALSSKVEKLEYKLRFLMLENLQLINALRDSLAAEPKNAFDTVDPSYGSTPKSRVTYDKLGEIFDLIYAMATE